MELFKLFFKYAPNRVFLAMVTGVMAGILYAFLIPVIMTALAPTSERLKPVVEKHFILGGIEVAYPKFAFLFLILCLLILISRTISQVLLARLSMTITSQLRSRLYDKILAAPVAQLEKKGDSQLIQSMTTDVQRIVVGARLIPDMLTQFITLIGLLAFLGYLNQNVLNYILVTIAFGVVTFQIPMYIGQQYFKGSRKNLDKIQDGFNGLINGAKELKLNRIKSENYLKNKLHKIEDLVVKQDKTGHTIVQVATNYGDLICFFAIGAIGFIFINYHAITPSELAGVIMALLYITGPVAFILHAMPQMALAQVSLKKTQKLLNELEEEPLNPEVAYNLNWEKILFKNICYRHNSSDEFKIGPLSGEIRRGEITFVVGGNGSGKSTFLKALSLHYLPSDGEIYFDKIKVDKSNMISYRQEIACIYSDYYLFEEIHSSAFHENELEGYINNYLEMMNLSEKVSYTNGKFSTLKLSDGQRRRLALLVALLDDKSFYVFDEWAADQDPEFKDIFYNDILHNLKLKGKVVVVISHDDRYFEVADQLLYLENGVISRSIKKNKNCISNNKNVCQTAS